MAGLNILNKSQIEDSLVYKTFIETWIKTESISCEHNIFLKRWLPPLDFLVHQRNFYLGFV